MVNDRVEVYLDMIDKLVPTNVVCTFGIVLLIVVSGLAMASMRRGELEGDCEVSQRESPHWGQGNWIEVLGSSITAFLFASVSFGALM